MILYFVLVGFVTGAIGAGAVLAAGGGILFAILAYSAAGALGVVLSALAFALAPSFPRPRGGMPVRAHTVNAQTVKAQPVSVQPVNARSVRNRPPRNRPVGTRHVRVQAQAPRR